MLLAIITHVSSPFGRYKHPIYKGSSEVGDKPRAECKDPDETAKRISECVVYSCNSASVSR